MNDPDTPRPTAHRLRHRVRTLTVGVVGAAILTTAGVTTVLAHENPVDAATIASSPSAGTASSQTTDSPSTATATTATATATATTGSLTAPTQAPAATSAAGGSHSTSGGS